jgi:hypothetical protein
MPPRPSADIGQKLLYAAHMQIDVRPAWPGVVEPHPDDEQVAAARKAGLIPETAPGKAAGAPTFR